MRSVRFRPAAAGLVVLALAAGCDREFAVRGTVRYADGRPLDRGQVVLESAEMRVGGGGDVRKDGSFVTRPLPAGRYTVHLIGVGEPAAPDMPAPPPVVDLKFTDPATSGLTVEVGPDAALDITVEPPPKKKKS